MIQMVTEEAPIRRSLESDSEAGLSLASEINFAMGMSFGYTI